MRVREPQGPAESDAEFEAREEANLAAIAKDRARLATIRGNIETLFKGPKPKVRDIIGRERKL